MSYRNVQFDKKGLFFTLGFVSLVAGIVALAHVDSQLLAAFFNKTKASLSVVEQPLKSLASTAATQPPNATPQRILNRITIADAILAEGKFIAADLVNMKLSLYQDSALVAEYPIKSKGRPGTPWETPSGFYSIQTKEKSHFSSIGKVYMPYSMQFYGNYFIHGWTYYPDGTPTPLTFSGGCIKLETDDAQKVFEFADLGTKIFVYDAVRESQPPSLTVDPGAPLPQVNAPAYLVADIDTGDIFAEAAAGEKRPIASVTKLMTALVANEVISFDKEISVMEGSLVNPPILEATTTKTFLVGDLLYPLLMQSSNIIADRLASYWGKSNFVSWMNTTARALEMHNTTFADASGISPNNISTPEDLFRLATYLSNKKSFVLKITKTQVKTITADDGSSYTVTNVNAPADIPPFEGGKVGHTSAAQDTMVSVLSLKVADDTRRIAIIVLGSSDQAKDTQELAAWVASALGNPTPTTQTACTNCSEPHYRQIEL